MKQLQGWMQKRRRFLLIGLPIIFCLVLGIFFLLSGRYVSTDDAYLQAVKASISANVSGPVIKIYAHDNQRVKKGQLLFSIDPRPYQIAKAEAKASLLNSGLEIQALKARFQQQLANVKKAQFMLSYQMAEFNRQKKLAAVGLSSQMQLNKTMNALQTAEQQLSEAVQAKANILASLANDLNLPINKHPRIMAAQAQLDRAKLNLGYTQIRAPMDGIVAKVEQIQVGDYIRAGSPVFALISVQDVWVEANLKETDLTHIRPGQKAIISIDAYDKELTGYVASTSPGTGSSFSLLPPENATGNWVKITQRVPVRIAINHVEDLPFIALGLSADVTIDTQHNRLYFLGKKLHLSANLPQEIKPLALSANKEAKAHG